MRWTPHALIEGCAIGAHAIGAETADIYIRGEFTEPLLRMNEAVREAYDDGILGRNAMGTGKRVDVHVHKGAGAYICGEETAMMTRSRGAAAIRESSRRSGGRRSVRTADHDQQRRDAGGCRIS